MKREFTVTYDQENDRIFVLGGNSNRGAILK